VSKTAIVISEFLSPDSRNVLGGNDDSGSDDLVDTWMENMEDGVT